MCAIEQRCHLLWPCTWPRSASLNIDVALFGGHLPTVAGFLNWLCEQRLSLTSPWNWFRFFGHLSYDSSRQFWIASFIRSRFLAHFFCRCICRTCTEALVLGDILYVTWGFYFISEEMYQTFALARKYFKQRLQNDIRCGHFTCNVRFNWGDTFCARSSIQTVAIGILSEETEFAWWWSGIKRCNILLATFMCLALGSYLRR